DPSMSTLPRSFRPDEAALQNNPSESLPGYVKTLASGALLLLRLRCQQSAEHGQQFSMWISSDTHGQPSNQCVIENMTRRRNGCFLRWNPRCPGFSQPCRKHTARRGHGTYPRKIDVATANLPSRLH